MEWTLVFWLIFGGSDAFITHKIEHLQTYESCIKTGKNILQNHKNNERSAYFINASNFYCVQIKVNKTPENENLTNF